jgi:hypothetical protein
MLTFAPLIRSSLALALCSLLSALCSLLFALIRVSLLGSGKSTMLKCLAAREVPIPNHIDIWFLNEEAHPTEVTALQTVINTAADEVFILLAPYPANPTELLILFS